LSETPETFYREQVPAQFNRTLADQRKTAAENKAAAQVLEEMEAVRASIVVEVVDGSVARTDAPSLRVAYDIDRGEMKWVNDPKRTPFLLLAHSRDDFENLRRECGDSLLGFLGGLAGLGDEMRLTSQRVRSLRELEGGIVFDRVGSGGFALHAHFGTEHPRTTPRATIRLDESTYARLRAGELDPQDAFLAGDVELEGDEGLAIELALTALAPD